MSNTSETLCLLAENIASGTIARYEVNTSSKILVLFSPGCNISRGYTLPSKYVAQLVTEAEDIVLPNAVGNEDIPRVLIDLFDLSASLHICNRIVVPEVNVKTMNETWDMLSREGHVISTVVVNPKTFAEFGYDISYLRNTIDGFKPSVNNQVTIVDMEECDIDEVYFLIQPNCLGVIASFDAWESNGIAICDTSGIFKMTTKLSPTSILDMYCGIM